MWFVYTYIMYGDSDNDESSTNSEWFSRMQTHSKRTTMNDVVKAFSTIKF